MKIEQQVDRLKPELESIINSQKSLIEDLQTKAQTLMELSAEGEDNWTGAWASNTYNHYQNFIQRRDEDVELGESDIQKHIEKKGKITFDQIRKEIPALLKANKNFREKLVTELSIIKGQPNLEPEIEILNKIEKQDWGIAPSDLVNMRKPQKVIVRNPAAVLNKGLQTPPHINVTADVMNMYSVFASILDFQKNTKRLLRQLELKFGIEEVSETKSDFIVTLINSFHSVARQIRNRYSNRQTISIKDEYDVQDLFHALLKIQFEDIRPEENTPSYAGSGTRIDFLLKKEKIVIEIKKTRDNLTDKEIGNQLILDAQHYKSHPDCKKLICFVYDPENRVENPRGLENDLNQLTSDELIVEAYIRP
jgi:hypothetical protein